MMAAAGMIRGLGYLLGLSVETMLVFEALNYGVSGGIIAATLDRRVAPMAVSFAVCCFPMALFPSHIFEIFGFAVLVGTIPFAFKGRR